MRFDACQLAHQDMIKYLFSLAVSKKKKFQNAVYENAIFKNTIW